MHLLLYIREDFCIVLIAGAYNFCLGRCRTISLETGTQNVQMCLTMLQLSFTAEQLAQIFNFTLAYGLFQMLDGFLMVAGT